MILLYVFVRTTLLKCIRNKLRHVKDDLLTRYHLQLVFHTLQVISFLMQPTAERGPALYLLTTKLGRLSKTLLIYLNGEIFGQLLQNAQNMHLLYYYNYYISYTF